MAPVLLRSLFVSSVDVNIFDRKPVIRADAIARVSHDYVA